MPTDGGTPVATGAGDALRAVGLKLTEPSLMIGDRVLFGTGFGDRSNVWQIRLSPRSSQVSGAPSRLTFGTLDEDPSSVSATGMVALQASKSSTDFYIIPMSSSNGQPTAASRRLTQDGRYKFGNTMGGAFGSIQFFVSDSGSGKYVSKGYSLDLESGKQTLVIPERPIDAASVASADGRQIAYSTVEGDGYSIRVGEAGAGIDAARVLCKSCGMANGFSSDGRFLIYQPERTVKPDPKRKYTLRLLEAASGKDRPWNIRPIPWCIGGCSARTMDG